MIAVQSKFTWLAGMEHDLIHRAMLGFAALFLTLGGQALAQDRADVDAGADGKKWSIAIHGGAGTILRENMTPELEAEYEAALQNALDTGARILAEGGSAVDAIQATIVLLEGRGGDRRHLDQEPDSAGRQGADRQCACLP